MDPRIPDHNRDQLGWSDHLDGDADGLGAMRGMVNGLLIVMALAALIVLSIWAWATIRDAIGSSGSAAQVTAPASGTVATTAGGR